MQENTEISNVIVYVVGDCKGIYYVWGSIHTQNAM